MPLTSGSTLLEIAFRTGFVYLALLLGLRLTGKRQVGQMTPFDFLLLLLLANAVQNAMTGPDTTLAGGLVAAATLFGANFVISWIVRPEYPPGGGSVKAREGGARGSGGGSLGCGDGAGFRAAPRPP